MEELRRKLVCLAHWFFGYNLSDIRAIEASRALRRMPKGTSVRWDTHANLWTCHVLNSQGVPVWNERLYYSDTRSGAVLDTYDVWRAYCGYHGIRENTETQPEALGA